eukprot:SAG22_NODE_13387_length_408_cov_1.954693_1_plen_83_part_01
MAVHAQHDRRSRRRAASRSPIRRAEGFSPAEMRARRHWQGESERRNSGTGSESSYTLETASSDGLPEKYPPLTACGETAAILE